MRTMMKLGLGRFGITLVAGAMVALGGCAGVGDVQGPAPAASTAPTAIEAARAPTASAAAEAERASAGSSAAAPMTDAERVAAAEAERAAAAKLRQPIGEDEAAELRATVPEARATTTRSEAAARTVSPNDIIHICTHCFLPDLKVVEDDRDQWLNDPSYGPYLGDARGFTITNAGLSDAGTFHVAVLQTGANYGFDVDGLKAGESRYFQITTPSIIGPACGNNATVIVNPFAKLPELSTDNNSTIVYGICYL